MTDLQRAKLNRNAAVVKFLDNNKPVFEKDVEMNHFYKKLVSDHAQSLVSAEDLEEDGTAFTEQKLVAKKEVCEMAQLLCSTAKEAFWLWGDKVLYKKTKVGYLHFFRSNDFYTEEHVKELHKLLNNHIKSLSPEFITEEQLDEFKNKIKVFVETKGSSSINDRPSLEVIKRLKMDLKVIEVDIEYIFNHASKYKNTDETFYNGLIECNTIPEKKETSETVVEFTIIDSDNNIALQDVYSSLSKSFEKLKSNEEGKIVYNNTKAGRVVATFLLEGYKECVSILKIKAGMVNRFDVSMEKE